jgi:hypothetical protein
MMNSKSQAMLAAMATLASMGGGGYELMSLGKIGPPRNKCAQCGAEMQAGKPGRKCKECRAAEEST